MYNNKKYESIYLLTLSKSFSEEKRRRRLDSS